MKQSIEGRWPRTWTDQIGRAVARHRKLRGISAAGLSELCASAGFPIPRNTITNLENGRKEALPVHELVVIAEALEVSPQDLLFPAATDETVAMAHGEQDIVTTSLWFSGAGFGENPDSELSLYVTHLVRVQRVESVDASKRPDRGEVLAAEIRTLATLRSLIIERTLRLPSLAPRVAELLEDFASVGAHG